MKRTNDGFNEDPSYKFFTEDQKKHIRAIKAGREMMEMDKRNQPDFVDGEYPPLDIPMDLQSYLDKKYEYLFVN